MSPREAVGQTVVALLAFAFVLILHGAVPFVMLPTLGQAVWTTGFALSFANGPLHTIHAHDFGLPEPAAIAFGLAGALPTSFLIRVGLHPADAYSAMVALWLAVAFGAAYTITRHFGGAKSTALAGATAWLSMPVIWAHAGYSMVSLGFALLPLYFLSALLLFFPERRREVSRRRRAALYLLATTLAVFMDGYSFVMFAAGASILFLAAWFGRDADRADLLRIALPVHVASFGFAYLAYTAYVDVDSFGHSPIELFRGFGVDLTFLLIPTTDQHWLADLFGLSRPRSMSVYFGDSSVWQTTFSIHVIVLGIVAAVWSRPRALCLGVLLVGSFALYMALGPSLKIDATKPEGLHLAHPSLEFGAMPAELAVMPTGNSLLSEHLPGFSSMRAAYRWMALCVFACWLLIIVRASSGSARQRKTWLLLLLLITAVNLPDLSRTMPMAVQARAMFLAFDQDVVGELGAQVGDGATALFLPWGNDFAVNYLAPRAGFRTFNIGGDKNLAAARQAWPSLLRSLPQDVVVADVDVLLRILADETIDMIVIPYFHLLWSVHYWPCLDLGEMRLTELQRQSIAQIPESFCPDERRQALRPLITVLEASPYFDVADTAYAAVLRLPPAFGSVSGRDRIYRERLASVAYPIEIGPHLEAAGFILDDGWHAVEDRHTWSDAAASLMLPRPDECAATACQAALTFLVFGASPERPVSVHFEAKLAHAPWRHAVTVTSGDPQTVHVPLIRTRGYTALSIAVPDAASPFDLFGTSDQRVLGLALGRIDLILDE